MENEDGVWVPNILKVGRRGVRAKIWAFMHANPSRGFTAREIAKYLEMPLSTVQIALKDLCSLAPRIKPRDKEREGKGRPEKEYRFQRILQR